MIKKTVLSIAILILSEISFSQEAVNDTENNLSNDH